MYRVFAKNILYWRTLGTNVWTEWLSVVCESKRERVIERMIDLGERREWLYIYVCVCVKKKQDSDRLWISYI